MVAGCCWSSIAANQSTSGAIQLKQRKQVVVDIRTLKPTKLAAALSASSNLALEEIQEIPLATAANRKYMLPLICLLTGITCGAIHTITVAGSLPLLGQWKDTQVFHPIFSLDFGALLNFSKNTWLRFCALSPEETANSDVIAKQEQMLQVCTIAILHRMTTVDQKVTWLPSWLEVSSNWESLLRLAYWRCFLDSQKFRFPSIRLSKQEPTIDLQNYLQICWTAKKAYEHNINDLIEEAKKEVADKALIRIRDAIAGKKPLSPKVIYRWFRAVMPTRYAKDIDGWMSDIFHASEKDITEFTLSDIETFEEMALTELELGSSMSHAFFEILKSKHALLTDHFETYEILMPTSPEELLIQETIAAQPEPKLADFPGRVQWFRAHAQWKLAQPSARKHTMAEIERQKNRTVRPTFIPRFPGTGREEDFLDGVDDLEADEPSQEDFVDTQGDRDD